MAQTADFPSREPAYQILREGARLCLELRPRTLRSRAALLYERIYESLMPLKKVKEHPRCRVALDTANTPCAEHAGARHQADFTSDACRFGVHLAHARCLRLAYASRVRASRCTDLYGKCAVSVRFCTVLVCQANWQKVGGGSPPIRRPDGATFLREPCAGSRERAGEASVAV